MLPDESSNRPQTHVQQEIDPAAASCSSFKSKYSAFKRKKWAIEALKQHPNKFPLIIERAPDKKTRANLAELANPKFLMPAAFSVAEVLVIIKKKLNLTRDEARGVVLFAGGRHLLRHDDLLAHVYQKHRDREDDFLYLLFAEEQLFGI